MNTKRHFWTAVGAALLLAAPFLAHSQFQIPAAINYQGKLTDQMGNPLVGGYYVVQFRIWKDATKTGVGELIWGRSFPLHVVTNGLFNVLLTDDGGPLADGGTGGILDAFGDKSRYLGLTVIQNPAGTVPSPSEIKPRQQLVSAPFAIQAHTANHVAANGVDSMSLSNASVTTEKIAPGNVTSGNIASNAVITAKIADNAVTTEKIAPGNVTTTNIADSAVIAPKIANGAVTSAKLNIDGTLPLNGHTLGLGSDGSANGLVLSNGFGSVASISGPALYGDTGGVLGTTSGGAKAALSWTTTAVGIEQRFDAYGSFVNLSSHVNAVGTTPVFTALADGMMMFYGRRGQADLQVWVNGGTLQVFNEASPIQGCPFWYDLDHSDGRMVTWPIKKGDKFRWNIRLYDTGSTYNPVNNYLYFLPLGKNQATSSISQ